MVSSPSSRPTSRAGAKTKARSATRLPDARSASTRPAAAPVMKGLVKKSAAKPAAKATGKTIGKTGGHAIRMAPAKEKAPAGKKAPPGKTAITRTKPRARLLSPVSTAQYRRAAGGAKTSPAKVFPVKPSPKKPVLTQKARAVRAGGAARGIVPTTRHPLAAGKTVTAGKVAAETASRAPAAPVKARPGPVAPAVRTVAHPLPAGPVAGMLTREAARDMSLATIHRALDLLEVLARTGPVPLTILAEAAKTGKTATQDMMGILRTRNFVVQDDAHGLWRLGARWAVLGRAASEQGALAATAMPHLAALGNATGENVYLRVRDGLESETAAIYQTDPGLRIYTEVGKKMPLHAGSGRVLLAHAPEAVQTQVLTQRLQRYTPSTRTDPGWVAADLQRIRQRGYLITDSEVVAGTVSITCPVRDASGQVIAALLIGAPSLRMRPPRPRALLPAVLEAAGKLSQALGAVPEASAETRNPRETHGPAAAPPVGASARASGFPPSGRPWPAPPANASAAAALGAAIARPHTIFR